ncbi:PucR family transcriptional regulator [Nocardioides ginsengisoli]|uniref:PucR family transcriptional regulator n=1 Tax=Nocardioides ginsengisoli TaxID=363868 RepID=A0ABW3W895_9ACTN
MPLNDAFEVPLAELLANPSLGLTQVAGPADTVSIRAVATTELADPTPYVEQGELLLTSGLGLADEPGGFGVYVERVATAGVAALGFGVEPVFPSVPQELVDACERHRLRLLDVPTGTPFVAVSRAFTEEVARRQHREFEAEARAMGALAGAAGGADPIRSLVRELARRTSATVVLLDPDGNALATGGRLPAPPIRQLLRDHAASLQHSGTALATSSAVGDRLHLNLQVVPTGSSVGSRLVLALTSPNALTLSERRTTASALWLLAALVSPRYALEARTEGIGALVRLLTRHRVDDLDQLLRSGAAAVGEHWVVVRGQSSKPLGRGRRDTAVDIATMRTVLGTPYLDLADGQLTALIPCDRADPPATPSDVAGLGWALAYSAPFRIDELPEATAQADRMLRRALAGEDVVMVHRAADVALDSLVQRDEALAFARSVLRNVHELPADQATVLLSTLHTWLACHGSTERTSTILGVHRNTVRHRLTQVSTLLGADLQDPETRMTLWFALSWIGDAGGLADGGRP